MIERFRCVLPQVKLRLLNTTSIKSIKAQTNKESMLKRAILINQFMNLFIFPFPIKWNKTKEQYEVIPKSLRFYWRIIHLKFAYAIISMIVGIRGLSIESYQNRSNAVELLFLNVTVLVVMSFADAVFIINAHEIVNSFNWSYKMQQLFLLNQKTGKLIKYLFTY